MFCEIYEEIYNQRKRAKEKGPYYDEVINAGLKLALNGTYGKSNDKYSYLYDPKFMMSITLNGQLLLTMLAERFAEISTILQCNTDGIVIKIHKSKVQEMHDIVKWWEELTKLELESANYSKIIIADVNNYIAVYTNGKVKYKGKFEIDKIMKGEMQYHKDHSSRIVPLALSRYFIDGISIEDTINNHLNSNDYGKLKNHGIFDFCLAKKSKGTTRGIPKMTIKRMHKGEYQEVGLQKTNRYYVSNRGWHIVKAYDDGKKDVKLQAHPQKGKGWKVTVLNNYEKQEKQEEWDVNYNFYIREANKIKNSIIELNYTLF